MKKRYTYNRLSGTDIVVNESMRGVVEKLNWVGVSTQGQYLPIAYTQVDYVQSTGTQYINTGYIANQNTKVETNFMYDLFNGSYLFVFGGRTSATSRRCCFGMEAVNSMYFQFGDGTNIGQVTTTTIAINTKYKVTMQNGNYALNDVTQLNYTTVDFTTPVNVYLFANNNNGTLDRPFKGKIYDFKIWESGVLVRNFVPCFRNSDNVIGMYDTVNNVFYTNAGTGTFTKGNNIILPTPNYPVPIYSSGDEGKIVMWSHKKNMFDGTFEQGTLSSSTGLPNSSTFRVRTIGFQSLNPSTQYIVNCVGMVNIIVMQYDKDNAFLGTSGFQSIPYTFTSNASARFYKLVARISDSTVVTPSDISNVQFETGNIATTYEPYTGSTTDITTPVGYVGGSLPNGVADTDTQKKIGKVVLNGSESWGIAGEGDQTNGIAFYRTIPDMKPTSDRNAILTYCDKFRTISSNAALATIRPLQFSCRGLVQTFVINIERSRLVTQDVAGFKTWLSSNNVTVYYELATPVDITITKPLVPTYEGINTITTTNNVKPTLTIEAWKR